ncbi:sensor histidine kinase [Formosa undariae]|uniref:Sensor histidine kinase n=1 Tax=Formosa undariae TaxID=1325436 RepID=A0ABV5EWP6_9FLAO
MKKKILLLISVLIVIVSISIFSLIKEKTVISSSQYGTFRNYSPTKIPFKPENRGWDYVKNRLFDGKTSRVPKFTGAISYALEGATAQDSLVVENLMSQLRVLAPNKTIEYFHNTHGILSEDRTFVTNKNNDKISLHDSKDAKVITLSFGDKEVLLRDLYSPGFIKLEDGGAVYLEQYTHPGKNKIYSSIYFNFPKDISFEKREQNISYFFWRSLCKIHLEASDLVDVSSVSELMINSVFNTVELNPINYSFTEDDKFLLKKLYSDDFLSQFKDFLYSNYQFGYAFNFINYGLMRSVVISIIVLLSLIVFVLSFSIFSTKKFKYSYLNFLTPFLIASIVIVNLYFFNSNMKYEFKNQFQVGAIIVFIISGILLAVISSFFTWVLEKYLLKDWFDFSVKLVLKSSFVFLAIQLPMMISNFITNKFFEADFDYTIVTNVALLLALGRGILIYLNHFSESLVKEKDVELSRLKEVNAQSELKLLQSHINPHFLYNALNSIAGLAHTNADKTEKMALSLSDLFRYSINKKGEKMSTIEEEVQMVENYLDIEKIRFGDRLTFQLDIDKSILDKKIPMYILQPLVENAIKHGISKIRGEAKIALQIIKEENNLFIRVSDNGPDFPKSLISGHGLQTVNDLLRLSYGDNASLTWENTTKKTITVNLPLNH